MLAALPIEIASIEILHTSSFCDIYIAPILVLMVVLFLVTCLHPCKFLKKYLIFITPLAASLQVLNAQLIDISPLKDAWDVVTPDLKESCNLFLIGYEFTV